MNDCSISNLDLSRFKLKKEDVSVTLGDLSELNRQVLERKQRDDNAANANRAAAAAAAAATTTGAAAAARDGLLPETPQRRGQSVPPPPLPTPHSASASSPYLQQQQQQTPSEARKKLKADSTLLTIKARNISAEFVALHWSYKQKFFPYLEGGGSCDAVVEDASITLSFEIRRDFRKKKAAADTAATPAKQSSAAAAAGVGSGATTPVAGEPSVAASAGDEKTPTTPTTTTPTTTPQSSQQQPMHSAKGNMATGTEGSGVIAALLEVAGASDSLVTAANSMGGAGGIGDGKKGQPGTSLIWEPVLILGNCDIQIEMLELRMAATGSMAWVYNLLAGLFRDQIREYVIASLGDTITENAEALLSAINGFVRNSWPVIAAATHANLDTIPLLERDVAAGQSHELRRRTAGGRQIRIKLEQAGALGLHLDINTKRGIIRFSAPVAGGQVYKNRMKQNETRKRQRERWGGGEQTD